jgi:glutathione synthase/RimK-type ligase-like ATP-grasp enzyme
MKHILTIGGISNSQADVDEIRDYAAGVQTAAADTAEVQYTHLDTLDFVFAPGEFRIYDTKNRRSLQDNDLIILRSKMRLYGALAYCLSKFCQAHDIPHFNDYSGYFNGTKIVQAVLFYELDVPFLKTVYALDPGVLLQAIRRELTPPFIIKDAHGAHGRDNYLVRSYDEAAGILSAHPNTQFIAQEFCPNSKDYRVLILDDKHLVFSRTGEDGSHLNNTSQGGQAVLEPNAIPAALLADAHRIAKGMHLDLAGVDIIPNSETGALYFLEVNSQPQVFTGALLPEKAALYQEFLSKRLRGN